MIVADVTRPSTIDSMLRLGRLFSEILPGRYCAHVLNKMDLDRKELADDPAAAAAMERLEASKVPLFETSARTGANVAGAFHEAAIAILQLER